MRYLLLAADHDICLEGYTASESLPQQLDRNSSAQL